MAMKKAGYLKLAGIFLAVPVIFSLFIHPSKSGVQGPSDNASGVQHPSDHVSREAELNSLVKAAETAHAKQMNFAMEAGRALHASMRDPDSLVIDDGRVNDDATLVCVEYRARNGFNGMNREFIAYDGNGKPHQNAGYWNAHCKKPMNVMTFAVTYGLSH